MIKILKYLKNSVFSIFGIVGLLVLQAFFDLTLPDYTSKIVNVGVQQSGIENAAIVEIGESSLNKLMLFTSELDKNYIYDCYYEDGFVNDTQEKKYALKEDCDLEQVSNILAKPMLILTYIKNANISGNVINFIDVPEGIDPIDMITNMSVEDRLTLLNTINTTVNAMPESIINSTAVEFVKEEYVRLDIDNVKIQNAYIFKTGLMMIVISLATMAVGILTVFVGSRMAAKLGYTLRSKVFKKVVGFSKSEIKTYGQSSLITRTTNDIQQVQSIVVFLLRVVFYAPIIGIGGVVKAYNTNPSMTYVIGIAVLSITSLVIVLFSIAMPKFKIIQKLVDKVNLVTREILTGLPVIRAFSNEKYEEKRFDMANKGFTNTNIFIGRVMSFMMPAMMFIMNIISLIIVYVGAKNVDSGVMQVGDIMAYIQYTMQIISAFLMISTMSIMLPRASVSAKRIIEVIETEDTIKNPVHPEGFDETKKGIIEFQNVSFRYPDADYDVITDINFTAVPGETTAFIGSTGSGKSTLINLIPRFYDVTSGSILVNGKDVKVVDVHDLRDSIGFVPQKGVLFTGDIESNVNYGNEVVDKQNIKEAIRISQAEEFVSKLKGKTKYKITQGGTNVSGGQKQRLAIARAIAKSPDIYIFDDSFSALDFKTDAKLRSELKKATKDKTVIIVAQRISTIMNAEQIIVLDEGKIVGKGTHKQLMKKCKVYKEIALSQLSKEELVNES
ncbi:MAG: ABC transporter ATP-binding protein [Firmicutes bacterium]|nr:ABC transporter ATP-binding protein [Bacillota bacterium]